MPQRELTAAVWKKSTRSGGSDNCVEVAILPESVGVRDTKARHSGTLTFTTDTWRNFLAALNTGRYSTRHR